MLSDAEIRDILLYLASWNIGYSHKSRFEDESLSPSHLSALTAVGLIQISDSGRVFSTETGDEYVARALSSRDSFLSRYWRHIDFTYWADGNGVIDISFQKHTDLFEYSESHLNEVAILHVEADQELALSFVEHLVECSVKVRAVAVDSKADDCHGTFQRVIGDSLFVVVLLSAAYSGEMENNVGGARLIELNLWRNEGFVLPVILPGTIIPTQFDGLGCVVLSELAPDRVAELLVQRVARPPVLSSMEANPGRLTNEQKCQTLLWSLMMHHRALGGCWTMITNLYDEDDESDLERSCAIAQFPILDSLACRGLVDVDIWCQVFPLARISENGRDYLRKILADRQSFIYRFYPEINTTWTIPGPWSLGLEPGNLTVHWKGVPIPMSADSVYEFDIALSFSGEDRGIAEKLSAEFKKRNLKVFYDKDETAELWGQPLYEYLVDVYRRKARYCIMLISGQYLKSRWAILERRAAQDRDLFGDSEYILPLRLDDSEVPGLLRTIGYLDYCKHSVDEIVELVISKLESC